MLPENTVKPIINVKNKQYQTFFMPVTTTVQTITRENTECMTQKNSLCQQKLQFKFKDQYYQGKYQIIKKEKMKRNRNSNNDGLLT